MDNQTTGDLFTQLIQKAIEAMGGAKAAFDPELYRQAAGHGKNINRLAEKAMEAISQWADSGSGKPPDPEAAARLGTALTELCVSLHNEYVGRYLNLPPLGVGRESSLKVLQAVEAHNRLWAGAAQFLNDFQRPFTQSLNRLPKVLENSDRPIENADDLYQVMRQVFDDQYQSYLASPEGVGQVSALIEQYLEFKKQFDDAIEPALKFYGLPSKADMTEVYRRLHRLRKSDRDHQARLGRQQTVIEELQKQVQALQAAAGAETGTARDTGSSTRKRPAPAKKAGALKSRQD